MIKKPFLLFIITIIFSGCNKLTSYKTREITIGNQVWMLDNLNVDKFNNGDPIPQAKTNEEWEKAGENKQPAWCYYDNNPANGEKYGKLYNWYAVNDSRGLAPAGYHIPRDGEWTQLINYLGGETLAGEKLKSSTGWSENGNGTNESSFSGLPGGARLYNGQFAYIGYNGVWWSFTENSPNFARMRLIYCLSSYAYLGSETKRSGFSVRCVKD